MTTLYCGLADQPLPSQDFVASARKTLGVDQAAPLLMICANLDEERKGHRVLFQALASIVPEHPDLRLLVVGGGTPAHEASLRDAVTDLGLDENVLFLGYRTDASDLNAVVDVAVVPSVSFESTPYTVKEAARFGKPVITTTAGGCHEGVDNNVTGLVVEAGDVDSLALAIGSLIADPGARERMGRSARSLFLDRFLLQSILRRTEDLYL